jgi:hypothetical protein
VHDAGTDNDKITGESQMATSPLGACRLLALALAGLLLAACLPLAQEKKGPDSGLGPIATPNTGPPSGIAVPQVPVVRVNIDQAGKRACVEDTPVNITIRDDFKGDRLTITQTFVPPSLFGPKVDHYSSRALERLEIGLCGRQNTLEYRLAVSNRSLDRPRAFKIVGSFGPDYVTLDFNTNASGHHVALEQPVTIDMQLRGGQDQVQINAHTFAGGAFTVAADLGPDSDSFTLNTWSRPIVGDVVVKVEGKEGNDTIFLDLFDNASAFHVPAGGSLTIEASGDTLDQFDFGNDNVSDHGGDQVIAAFRGTVDGALRIKLHGDDTLARVKHLECLHQSQPCAFYCHCSALVCTYGLNPDEPPICDAPVGLERLLRENPAYANDTVKLRTNILAGSKGTVQLSVDGGLASDEVVLVAETGSDELTFYQAALTGGQSHPFKTDGCFASAGVTVSGCDLTLPGPGEFN